MIDWVLIVLYVAWVIAVSVIIGKIGYYLGRLLVFHRLIRSAPDCCVCGASNPNQCDNHTYLSQSDWYAQGHHPQAY